jgi:hypothetical protein
MLAKLFAVVEGEAKGCAGQCLKERNGCLIDNSGGAVGAKRCQEELSRPVHPWLAKDHHCSSMSLTYYRVSFKVADVLLFTRFHWAGFNTYSIGNPAPA